MRHRNKTNSLGRKTAHRKAMLANMATSLVLNKRIKTTVAKAKVLKTYIEPVITKSKVDSTNNRRTAFKYLRDKYAVSELFRTVAPKIADRPGGYTRILKLGNRAGDNADICVIELVDFNTTYNPNAEKATKKKRSRRGGKKNTPTTAVKEVKEEVVEETKETAEEVKEQATDKVEETKETVEEVKEQATDKAEEQTEDTPKENPEEPKAE